MPASAVDGLVEPPRERRRAGVRIRPVQASDAALLDEFVRGLSAASRQRRFHTGVREMPPQWLQRMTHPDPGCELALVALAVQDGRETCIAEARYVLSDDIAEGREFALAVADSWQGRGIGKTLLLRLGCHAARHAVPRLVGDVLHDNLPMIELARGLGYAVRRHPADARLVRVEQCFGGSLGILRAAHSGIGLGSGPAPLGGPGASLVLAGQASFETQGGPA